jgi:hypothetical protein
MGTTDKTIRFLVAAAIAVLYATGIIKGTLGLVLLILGGIFVFTSIIGFCPLYTLFGMNTCKTKKP